MDPLEQFKNEMAMMLKGLIGRLEVAETAIVDLKKLPARVGQVENENTALRKRVGEFEKALDELKKASVVTVMPPAPPSQPAKPSAWDELVAGFSGQKKS